MFGALTEEVLWRKRIDRASTVSFELFKERYNHRSETHSKPYYLALSDWIRSEKVTNLQETEIAVIVDQFTLWVDEKSVERKY